MVVGSVTVDRPRLATVKLSIEGDRLPEAMLKMTGIQAVATSTQKDDWTQLVSRPKRHRSKTSPQHQTIE